MLVKYKPEGQEVATEWEFDPARVRQSEAELIEKRAGRGWGDWLKEIQSGGSSHARRVLLWHLMRREHHTLRFEDTPDFYMGELEMEYSLADLQKLRAQVEASSLDDAEKAEVIEKLDLEMASRLGKEEVDPSDMGKAPSNDGD